MRRYSTIATILMLLLIGPPLRAQSELDFPHMAVGGNPAYETVVQLMNEVETSVSIVVEVFQGGLAGAANGTPLAVRFSDGTLAASQSLTLAPFGEFTTVLRGADGALQNGWVRVRSTTTGGKISGNLLFRQRSAGTIIDSVGAAGVQRFRHAVVQLDQRETGSDTGIAFVNPDNAVVSVTLDLFQGATRVATPVPVMLQANQHFARLVSELFPSFGNRQGTLVIETAAGRAIPMMALRLDGLQITSIPVHPLGFTFQYNVTNDAGGLIESGFWMFDLVGFNLVGSGRIESPSPAEIVEATGSWLGTSFQFRYRTTLADSTVGMIVFNGSSAGEESTVGADGKSKAVAGKVTTVGADGRVISVNNFTAFHKFGAAPQ